MRFSIDMRLVLVTLTFSFVIQTVYATAFVVNSTSGEQDNACEQPPAGDCTLRDAVRALLLENDAETDTLSFAGLPGAGPWVIELDAGLSINTTSGAIIDGWTAPGWNGSPLIEIRAGGILNVVAEGAILRGLSVPGGMTVQRNGIQVKGNYLGVDVTGLHPGTANTGLSVIGADMVIGTDGDGIDDDVEGNLIFGTGTSLIINSSSLGGTTDNIVAGNLIGVDATGAVGLPGDYGILLNTASVQRTRIGTDSNGLSDELEGNVIGGHRRDAIWAIGIESTIAGNAIGTDRTGCIAIPNGNGIRLASNNSITPNTGTVIGGAMAVQRNIIATNTGDGIVISGNAQAQVEVAENYLYRNGGLAINLSSSQTPTPNDPLDTDTGVNGLQNKPELESTVFGLSGTQVVGSLNSMPLLDYRIDFYASNACRGVGSGEAELYLGSTLVNTDDQGNAAFNVSVDPTSEADAPFVTALATDGMGNSSEVSECITPLLNITFKDNFEGRCINRFASGN